MMTHHSVMMSSSRFKNLKIVFDDFCSNSDIFRDVISLIIDQCDPKRAKGASGGHKVFATRAAQASEASLYIYIYIYTH